MRRLAFVTFFFLTCIVCSTTHAQTPISSAKRDTVIAPDTGSFHMTKSPLEAILLSAVLPGAGQLYLDQAWKLPILYGLIAGFGYGVYIQNSRYHTAIDSVNSEISMAHGPDSVAAFNIAQAWGNVREFYRNDRDKWWIYLGITYIANILDAYIAANLYDFDVSNPAPSGFESFYDPRSGRVGLSFTMHF